MPVRAISSHYHPSLCPAAIYRMKAIFNDEGRRRAILPNSYRMVRERFLARDVEQQRSRRRAAVLVPICSVEGVPSVLFTVRSPSMPTHASQISFPGGHIHEGETPTDAAIRETAEELGIVDDDKWLLEVLGTVEPVVAPHGVDVTPVIAVVTRDLHPPLFPDYDREEVSHVFTRSIKNLVRTEAIEILGGENDFGDKSVRRMSSPYFSGPQGKIWGLTAYILSPILKNVIVPSLESPRTKL